MSPQTNGPTDELAGIDAELRAYAGRTSPDASPAFLDRLELALAAQLPPPAEAPSLVIVKPSTSIVVPGATAASGESGRRFRFTSPLRVTMRLGLAMGLLALTAVGVFAATGVIPQELLPWNGGVVAAPIAMPEPTESPSQDVVVDRPAPALEPATDQPAEATDDPADAAGDGSGDTPAASHPTHEAPDAIEDLDGDEPGSDDEDSGSDGGDDPHGGGSSDDGEDPSDDGGSSDDGDPTDPPDGDPTDPPDPDPTDAPGATDAPDATDSPD